MTTPRPTISWSDLAGARVGVWGLGVEGRANLRKLEQLGSDVVLVDDRAGADDAGGRVVLTTAEGGIDALLGCDAVVKSPGISRYREDVRRLLDEGVPVVGGLGLWLEEADRSRVVVITGTKGKSTTTAIAGHLVAGLGHRCLLGGNLGVPPYDPAVGSDYDYWVVETSSYQALDIASSPPVVAVTSLHPDHLDWHGGVEQYYRDKLSLCRRRGADLTVANGDNELLRERRHLLGPRVEWITAPAADAAWMAPLRLLGNHSRRNALIARACLVALGVPGADDDDALRAAAEGFEPLESRLRVVAVADGVTFVDDSLATNVLPTLAALEAFPHDRVALLVGGFDRGIDYGALADGLARRGAPTLLLALPDSGPRIAAAVAARSPRAVEDVVACDDIADAVDRAFAWARPRGVVLLSPAAPSFGRFRDYRDRSAAFLAAVQAAQERA